MKGSVVWILFFLFGSSAWAQTTSSRELRPSKKEQKLYALLEQGDFKKLKKKSDKVLRKNSKSVHANYIISVYYLRLGVEMKSETRKKSYIANSLRHFKKVKNQNFEPIQELADSLHLVIKIMASDSVIKSQLNKQYRKWLLVCFKDSVPNFGFPVAVTKSIVFDSNAIGDSLRYVLLKCAENLEGVRYKYAGTCPKTGFDCSGFTQYVYDKAGLKIPHNAQMQSDLSKNREDLENLKPGDLVFFGSWNGKKQRTVHAGIIYAKNGADLTVIHCVSGGVSIEGENSSWDRYWIDRVLFGISMDTIASNLPSVE